MFLITGECLIHHRDYKKLIEPVVLEINLKLLWSHGVEETDDKELGHENYRYAAYSSIHLWLYGRKKTGRVVLPSCLVMGVHKVYPAPIQMVAILVILIDHQFSRGVKRRVKREAKSEAMLPVEYRKN